MKRPTQERSRATVEAIITAATRFLSTDNDALSFTTNTVAERAGVSVGSLYQYFPNKEALIAEISRRHELKLIETIREIGHIANGTTIRETVNLFITAHIKARLINPKLYSALIAYNSDEGSEEWLFSYKSKLIRSVAEHLSIRPRTANLDGLERIAFVLFGAVDGPVSEALENQRDILEDGTLETQLTTMVTSYLVELTGHPADA